MTLSISEVERRLPALDLIGDAEIRDETAALAADAPRYFWEVPASTSGYHNPLCRGERGLWTHTLMVATVVVELADSLVEQGRLNWRDVDAARSAALLHDMRKNGDPADPSDSSVSDHDLRMAAVIREESDLPVEVAEAVESHMGPWYDGPEPETEIERLVHEADMVASTSTITPGVVEPVPEELAEIDVEGVEL